jgi:hypothetical protein
MNKKIIAAVLAIFIIAFPFRRAFLSDEAPGIMMMFSFLLTVAGIIFFYYLTLEKSKE